MEWTETIPPWVIFAAVTLAGLLLLLILALAVRRHVGDSFPYTRQPAALTPDERSLYDALQQAVGDRALLLAKLPVADVLSVRTNIPRRRSARALERIAARSFDFVLCAPADTRPLVVIELDRQPEPGTRRRRDRLLDEACNAAGLGLLRVPLSEGYTVDDLRERLRPHIDRSEAFRPGDITIDGRREPVFDLPVE